MRQSLFFNPIVKSFSHLAFVLGVLILSGTSAQADWKDDVGTFRIGILGGKDPGAMVAKAEPFRLALEEKLGIPVSILPSPNLRSLVRSHIEGRNEYAILSASSYAAGWANCECIEPLVVAKSADTSSGVYSILIVRKGSAITKPANLLGKQIVALGKESTLGYSFPIHQLQQENIDLMAGGTQFVFHPSGEEALRKFADGEGDALIGWSSNVGDASIGYSRGTLSQLKEIAPDAFGNFQVIWKSTKVPHRVHSVRKSLAGEPKQLLRETLSTLFDRDPIAFDAIEPEFGGGFEITTQASFNALIEFAKSAVPAKIEEAADEPTAKEVSE